MYKKRVVDIIMNRKYHYQRMKAGAFYHKATSKVTVSFQNQLMTKKLALLTLIELIIIIITQIQIVSNLGAR